MPKTVKSQSNMSHIQSSKSRSRDNPNFPYLEADDFFKFPSVENADDGLVATGGNLSPGMLHSAYLQGIFPWFNEDSPILWWSPDPRFVLFPTELHIPESMRKVLNKNVFTYTLDTRFEDVIKNCAGAKRPEQSGTWITHDMIDAYCKLYETGLAHSVEAWCDGKLAGGFYGVLIGSVFFGESMFTIEPNASKAAFCHFVREFERAGGKLIDSQIYTDHIARFGGRNISRNAFLRYEKEYLPLPLIGKITL